MRVLDVGIDLDGVVYNFDGAFRKYLIEYRGYDEERLVLPVETWDHWQAKWDITIEEFMEVCNEATDNGFLFVDGDPFPKAVESIQRMKEQGHRIHFITARNFGIRSPHNTADWLDRHEIPFDSLVFTHEKHITRPDVMIDDRDKNFWTFEEIGVPVYLQTRMWNMHIDTPNRVADLEEYADAVERMANS
jgi:5'(3')-deoxyribonucleotidase